MNANKYPGGFWLHACGLRTKSTCIQRIKSPFPKLRNKSGISEKLSPTQAIKASKTLKRLRTGNSQKKSHLHKKQQVTKHNKKKKKKKKKSLIHQAHTLQSGRLRSKTTFNSSTSFFSSLMLAESKQFV